MGEFNPELSQVIKERNRLLRLLLKTPLEEAKELQFEFERVQERVDELLRLQHEWALSGLDAVIDRLDEIVQMELRRMSTIREPLAKLFTRLSLEDTRATIPPKSSTFSPRVGAHAWNSSKGSAGAFTREGLAALAEAEAGRELVLGKDPDALRFVVAFKNALFEWQDMPWCAAFVHWCVNQVGANIPVFVPDLPPQALPGIRKPTFAYGPAWKAWATQRKLFKEPQEFEAGRGDLVVFDWNGDGRNDHIGILLGALNGTLVTAEGNTRNSEGVRSSTALRKRDPNLVDGYIRLPSNFHF